MTRLLAYATQAVEPVPRRRLRGHPRGGRQRGRVIRLAAFHCTISRTQGGASTFSDALRNSGAAAILLPYRIHRAGLIGGETRPPPASTATTSDRHRQHTDVGQQLDARPAGDIAPRRRRLATSTAVWTPGPTTDVRRWAELRDAGEVDSDGVGGIVTLRRLVATVRWDQRLIDTIPSRLSITDTYGTTYGVETVQDYQARRRFITLTAIEAE